MKYDSTNHNDEESTIYDGLITVLSLILWKIYYFAFYYTLYMQSFESREREKREKRGKERKEEKRDREKIIDGKVKVKEWCRLPFSCSHSSTGRAYLNGIFLFAICNLSLSLLPLKFKRELQHSIMASHRFKKTFKHVQKDLDK